MEKKIINILFDINITHIRIILSYYDRNTYHGKDSMGSGQDESKNLS